MATAIGAHFFNLAHQHYYIAVGLALFLLSNHLLYKLKFNSYHQNGSTVTTILVFTSQVVSMAIYKMEDIGWKWVVGVILILAGTLLIESAKPHN
jgi:drug/metabolite transporter (DMT)-like permease